MKVLLVEDSERLRHSIKWGLMRKGFSVDVAGDGNTGLRLAGSARYDVIILDIMLPGMDGLTVLRRLRAMGRDTQVIILSARHTVEDRVLGLEVGADDYLPKPFAFDELLARIQARARAGGIASSLHKKNHALKTQNAELSEEVSGGLMKIEKMKAVVLRSMGVLANCRDPETGGHIRRTRNYVRTLAECLKGHRRFRSVLGNGNIGLIYDSSPLHDIGKIGINDKILLKPGRLDRREFDKMKLHTVYGRDAIAGAGGMLGEDSFLRLAEEIAYTHHEKWDGSGYPQGLRGEDIPVAGRLMAIADVYDALISRRPYKRPYTHDEAFSIITEGDGRTMPGHFDPDVLGAFREMGAEWRMIALRYSDVARTHEDMPVGRGPGRVG